MVKLKKIYTCQQCGYTRHKWSGQCSECSEWNTFIENVDQPHAINTNHKIGKELEFFSLANINTNYQRYKTHIQEFDRVCGSGLVPAGSTVLVGGDPGIGKSTLLLQISAILSQHYLVHYISGEEAIDQIKIRASRLNISDCNIHLASSNSLDDIIVSLDKHKPQIVIIDSIQTIYSSTAESSHGSITQIKTCSHALINYAKQNNIIIIIIGHVTKDGAIAGPRVLEHMVDSVLYFEGNRKDQFRILRSVKNRFGSTNEIGVFEMNTNGLTEVKNPSAIFLNHTNTEVNGSAVFIGIEGTRPILSEVQSLIANTNYATPKRSIVGWDANRLAMIIAVLETRCGLNTSTKDIYLNIVGGLKIQDPAADLAVAASLMSSITSKPINRHYAFCGEICLSGEVKGISYLESRVKEAIKIGFTTIYVPNNSNISKSLQTNGIKIESIEHINDLKCLFN